MAILELCQVLLQPRSPELFKDLLLVGPPLPDIRHVLVLCVLEMIYPGADLSPQAKKGGGQDFAGVF